MTFHLNSFLYFGIRKYGKTEKSWLYSTENMVGNKHDFRWKFPVNNNGYTISNETAAAA